MDINKEDLDSVLTLCNSLKCATLCLSLDLFVTQANPVAELIFLHPVNKLINKSIHEICTELGVDSPIKLGTTPETLQQLSLPTTHYLPNQKLATVYWSTLCCEDEDGYTGYVLIGKSIISSSSNQSLTQMKNILRSLPCAVFTKDQAGRCLTVNKQQTDMAGFANENDMVGKTDYDMPWANVADTIRQADALAIAENKTIVIEEYGTLANGQQGRFLVTKSPLKDDDGNLIGVIGSAVNITQQQQSLFLNDASNVYLSKKEIECINWMIKGKSSGEMATILNLSKRTIETHVNNIKRKLNCYKQFQLGYLIGKYGYLLL